MDEIVITNPGYLYDWVTGEEIGPATESKCRESRNEIDNVVVVDGRTCYVANEEACTYAEWLESAGNPQDTDSSVLRQAWLAGEDSYDYRD